MSMENFGGVVKNEKDEVMREEIAELLLRMYTQGDLFIIAGDAGLSKGLSRAGSELSIARNIVELACSRGRLRHLLTCAKDGTSGNGHGRAREVEALQRKYNLTDINPDDREDDFPEIKKLEDPKENALFKLLMDSFNPSDLAMLASDLGIQVDISRYDAPEEACERLVKAVSGTKTVFTLLREINELRPRRYDQVIAVWNMFKSEEK